MWAKWANLSTTFRSFPRLVGRQGPTEEEQRMSTDEASLNEEQLARDAREFGLQIAKAVQSEVEGEASEERLQAMRSIFLQAIEHIEKRYGPEKAAMWQDEANQVIQQRFAALRPPEDSLPNQAQSEPDGSLSGFATPHLRRRGRGCGFAPTPTLTR